MPKRPTSRLATKGAVDYRQYMNPIENQGRCGLVFFFIQILFLKYTIFKDHVTRLLLQQLLKVHMH